MLVLLLGLCLAVMLSHRARLRVLRMTDSAIEEGTKGMMLDNWVVGV